MNDHALLIGLAHDRAPRYLRVCLWIAYLYQRQAEYDQGRVWLDKTESLLTQIENPVLEMGLLYLRMYDAKMRGDYALAHAYVEQQQNLAIAHAYFGRSQAALEDMLNGQRGLLLLSEGDYQQAKQLLRVFHAYHIKSGNLIAGTALARFLGYALSLFCQIGLAPSKDGLLMRNLSQWLDCTRSAKYRIEQGCQP